VLNIKYIFLPTFKGYCGIVELLICKGCSVSPVDEDLDTPLHLILTRHFDGKNVDQAHTSQNGQMLNPVIALELKKHENAPSIATVSV